MVTAQLEAVVSPLGNGRLQLDGTQSRSVQELFGRDLQFRSTLLPILSCGTPGSTTLKAASSFSW